MTVSHTVNYQKPTKRLTLLSQTIAANAPAGGAMTIAQEPTGAPAPLRMVRHRRNAEIERVAH
jgi:hypothetical protein